MAGVAGIEPAMTESKSVALTIGRHPNEFRKKYAAVTAYQQTIKKGG